MEYLVNAESLKKFLLILTTGLWIYWLWRRRNLYRFAFTLPGYFGLPIFGILYRVLHINKIMPFIFACFKELKEDTICVWLGVDPWLITRDPETIKNILSSSELLNKANVMYDSAYDIMCGGILASPVEEWQHHRKLLNPAFNYKVIANFLPIFNKTTNKMIAKFETLSEMGEKKLKHFIDEIFFTQTLETTVGKIINEDDEDGSKLVKNIAFLEESLVQRIMLQVLRLQGLFYFYGRYKKSANFCYEYVRKLIENRLKSLNSNHHYISHTKKADNDDLISIKKTPSIFIDHVLQLYQKEQFTWHDVISESFTIIPTAYDTTAMAIYFILVMLAMHSEVQEKLHEEIVDVFPDKNFDMTIEDMEKLHYLERVVNEALRLMPPGPLIGRQVVKDTQLTKNMILPKGLQVLISIFELHRNKKIWGPNANEFNPDNFLPGNMADKHSHAYIPFSKGVRNCLGWRYAMVSMKVMIAGCVKNFRFTTKFKFDDLQYLNHITLKYLVEPGIAIHRR